jgi:hypothetical protein
LIDLTSGFNMIDPVTESAGRTGPYSLDDLIHPSATRGDERFLADVEYRGEAISAEAGMGTDSTIVEDLDLLSLISIASIWNPVRVFLSRKLRFRVGAISEGLRARLPTAA